ncbi:FecR family protein [Gaoshiqia sp. Z1-71]|uniref:FecR family protein n=1 Tax=Gaoshiqia hydrogeniformans TaxID=3290090 RepID=UPI003BF8621A
MHSNKFDIEQQLKGYRVPETRSKEEAWNLLSKKIAEHKAPKHTKIRMIGWSSVAAAAVVLLYFTLFREAEQPGFAKNDLAPSQLVWLPDSSRVTLKTRSELTYSYRKRNGERVIGMKGEAFFEVKKGKTFRVSFPGGDLEVLGTAFNIQAYSPESGRVDCYEGSVKVSLHQQEIILKKGQAVTFDTEKADGPFEISPEVLSDLPEGTYYWHSRPLKEILLLICQREGYTLAASDSMLEQRFTGRLNLAQSGVSLQILSRAMNFNYLIENNKLQLIERN